MPNSIAFGPIRRGQLDNPVELTDCINSNNLGDALQTSPNLNLPKQLVEISPALNSIAQAQNINQQVKTEHYITVNASPNMDEKLLAHEVQKALDEREQRALSRQRAFLFDVPV